MDTTRPYGAVHRTFDQVGYRRPPGWVSWPGSSRGARRSSLIVVAGSSWPSDLRVAGVQARRRHRQPDGELPAARGGVDRGAAHRSRSGFPAGRPVTGQIVYRRAGGLTEADRASDRGRRSAGGGGAAARRPAGDPVRGRRAACWSRPAGDLAYTMVAAARRQRPDRRVGRRPARGGAAAASATASASTSPAPLGFNADFEEVFGDIDTKVLSVTVVLVLVLLGLIYRSPVIALIPLFVVGVAYSVAQGLVYLYAKSGAHGQRQRHEHPRGPDVRGGDRLLPAARGPLPRGAAPARGQARARWRWRSSAPGRRSSPAG